MTVSNHKQQKVVKLLSVGEAASRLDARRRDLSILFYQGEFRDDLCPVVAGRRVIPENYLPMIEAALRRRGLPVREPDDEDPS